MALAMKDMVKGTIVDWRYKYDPDERTEELRNPWFRGIIMKVVGDTTTSVSEIWVQFGDGEKPIKVAARELTRYLPWNSKRARREFARLSGNRELSGIFESRPARVKPRGVDKLGLTQKPQQMLVEPENDEESDLIGNQTSEPLVVADTEPEAPVE